MLIHYLVNVRREFVVMTLDVKDAFLMASQPATENAFVKVDTTRTENGSSSMVAFVFYNLP